MKRRIKTISRAGHTVARVAIGSVREIRRALTIDGDIRSDVEFQNDVNAILAIIGKLTALGPGGAFEGEQEGEDIAIEVTPLPQPTAASPPPTSPPRHSKAEAATPAAPPGRPRRNRRP